jgi:uncharacterized membrane protein
MPVLIIVFALMIKMNKMQSQTWLIIIGLQLAVVVTGYVALESGETEEDKVEKVVEKKIIHEHEEAAEIFVGSTVLVLVLLIAVFFIRKDIGFAIKLGIAGIGLISCYLAYRTGQLGGELVYRHGAASAYTEEYQEQGLLPTPGKQSSESPNPTDDNESLKADDNDYGNSDEDSVIDDDVKQED